MLRLTTRVSSTTVPAIHLLLLCKSQTFIATLHLCHMTGSCCVVAGTMQYDECNHMENSMQPPAASEEQNPHASLTSCSYVHREGTREYMQAEVMPHLQRALEALALKIQEEQIKLAAGVDVEEGKYLPHGWRPFCPHRWLAEYLLAHQPRAAGAVGTVADMVEPANTAAVVAPTGE